MTAEPTTVEGRSPDWQNFLVTSATVNSGLGTTTLQLAGSLSGQDEHQFEGGTALIDFAVWLVHDHTNTSIDLALELSPPEISLVLNKNGIVRDDDPISGLLPYFATVDSVLKTVYADAYIDIVDLDPVYNLTTTVEFDLYITSTEFASGWGWNNSHDIWSSNAFWTSHLVACYQAGGVLLSVGPNDNDPDDLITNSTYPLGPYWPGEDYSELIRSGWTAGFDDYESIFLRAAIVDFPPYPEFESLVIAHEIAHSAEDNGDEDVHHAEGGLMTKSFVEIQNRFTAPTLNRLRKAPKW